MPGSLTLRTVAHQAPLSLGFSRQEHRSGLQCSPLGDLPNPGTESCLLRLLDWQTDSLPLAPPEKPANHLPCSKASPAVPLRNSRAFASQGSLLFSTEALSACPAQDGGLQPRPFALRPRSPLPQRGWRKEGRVSVRREPRALRVGRFPSAEQRAGAEEGNVGGGAALWEKLSRGWG